MTEDNASSYVHNNVTDAFTEEELKPILRKHELWLNRQEGGERAALNGVILRNINLSGANLRQAILQEVDFSDAVLRKADLRGADLTGANFCGANLSGADLSYADLKLSNMNFAFVANVDFYKADLKYVSPAFMLGLSSAKNIDTILAINSILPDGELIGWKKCKDNLIVKLKIPADSERVNEPGRRVCRASRAEVLEIYNLDGTPSGCLSAHSWFDPRVVYRVGQIVEPIEPFEKNVFHVRSSGIHFYITRKEAELCYIPSLSARSDNDKRQ